ncbi:hypothetical protein [Marinilabilia rubra]|uniref:Uncharacterized protein n=1 Tax=Marinilabilia rubra TaxID=2162893 RepID=A0A2U2B4F5_9BACT|nr:hypothetical protein [Marinilabilia rubra]PWD97936.1 hypothetical protein DDZ16_18445 [Marinilabilia rubra]
MKHTIIILLLAYVFVGCENPYELVKESKVYKENPLVSLSSEQAVIHLGVDETGNHTPEAGVFKDSLVLSHVLDHDINVTLELVEDETFGEVETHFSFQKEVTIKAGQNYGTYKVQALNVPVEAISKYKLSIRIKEVDDDNIIAGLYGVKKENEDRKKRFKTYSYQE